MQNLIYRRQFVLFSKKMETPGFFKLSKLNKFKRDCYLYSHQDLEVTTASNESAELIMLGYAIDPFFPERSNKEILENLMIHSSFDDVVSATDHLSGRYAMIYNNSAALNVFNDATSFREVYYCDDECEIACGSTPNILKNCLTIERNDEKKINEFFDSPEFNNRERYWIGTGTILKGVSRLMPNHYVDLVNKKMHRFWPVKERQILSLDEGSAIVAKLVSGTYAGAAARFKLVHSVTAGWDSRMLLACARNHVHNMQFYFYRGYKHNVDYEIAKQISDKFGLKARFVDLNDLKVDKDFEKIYYSNNILARPKLLKGYYDSYVNNLEGTVTISGTMGNEIVRIMSSLKRNTGNAHDIAKLLGYANYPYVIDSLNDWLKDSVYLKNKNHILIDLFCWEQFFANWGPLSGSEQDIVREELRPFNNRAVLSAILSLQDKNRYRDYPMIYVRTIKNLWPELLQFEVDIKRNSFKKVLRTIGIERVTDVVFHSVRNYRTSIKDYIKKAKILNNPLKPALSSNHL